MPPNATQPVWSGWSFPAKITAVFLAVAALAVASLAVFGLRQFRDVNAEHASVRIDRAARAATALLGAQHTDFVIDCDPSGSPEKIMIDDVGRLEPGDEWNAFVDQVGSVNQGAANVFRFNPTTRAFDRIATTFTTPAGDRVGGSQVEPGLLAPGHPVIDVASRWDAGGARALVRVQQVQAVAGGAPGSKRSVTVWPMRAASTSKSVPFRLTVRSRCTQRLTSKRNSASRSRCGPGRRTRSALMAQRSSGV